MLPSKGQRLKSKISKTYCPESRPTKSSDDEVNEPGPTQEVE